MLGNFLGTGGVDRGANSISGALELVSKPRQLFRELKLRVTLHLLGRLTPDPVIEATFLAFCFNLPLQYVLVVRVLVDVLHAGHCFHHFQQRMLLRPVLDELITHF